jgi:transcription antitermination factor NusG
MPFPLQPGEEAWFALAVRPRHEKAVAEVLKLRELESYLPLYGAARRWSDRTKIVQTCLFPGYVFCRFTYRRRLDVLNAPGVVSIVGFGDSPQPIPEAEIEAIRTVLASGLSAGPWPFLRKGSRVRILAGSMKGLEGILVREKEALRLVVSVRMLQRSVAVEVDRQMIEPLD